MPVIYWPRRTYVKWLLCGFMVLGVCLMWITSRTGDSQWVLLVYFLYLPLQFFQMWGNTRHVLSGGVFAVIRGTSAPKPVPLAAAELTRKGRRIRLQWQDGRRIQTLSAKVPGPFADAVEEAAQTARAAEPGSTPATAADAAKAVSFGFPAAWNQSGRDLFLLVVLVVLAGIGMWRNQPLYLLPLATMPLLTDLDDTTRLLVLLSADSLWLLRPGAAPYPIPISSVQEISSRSQVAVITTSDPQAPAIRLSDFHSPDLIRQLKRMLREGPTPPPETAGPPQPEAGSVLRCTLCGRPVPGARAGGTVHICDLCAGRARYEATEGGHGLTGKDQKPM